MTELRTLLVEDDPVSGAALAEHLESQGLRTTLVASLADARTQLADGVFDLVLLDIQLPDGSGAELLAELDGSPTDVVMISGQTTIEDTLDALRRGALDFLPKPIDMARLKAIIANLNSRMQLRGQVQDLRRQLIELGRFGGMVGSSPAMKRVYDCIERVAPTNERVLIIGPSGAGKEVAAATIQKLSRRSDAPYVAVNCGAISPALIESELFGHERGAFTGADRQRKGVFEQANGGTLFLDEVTEMPIELQVRLLRVLETDRITRVGGQKEIEVDVRLIAATNRDPKEAVASGILRHDLLYRLLVFPVVIPPLKDRDGDVRLLAQHFLETLDESHGDRRTLSAAALRMLEAHDWPGNVRELYNALRRAYIMSTDVIQPDDLLLGDVAVADSVGEPVAAAAAESAVTSSGESAGESAGDSAGESASERQGRSGDAADGNDVDAAGPITIRPGMSIAEAERLLILATLESVDGNKKAAVESLGISLKTLYSRLQVYSAADER